MHRIFHFFLSPAVYPFDVRAVQWSLNTGGLFVAEHHYRDELYIHQPHPPHTMSIRPATIWATSLRVPLSRGWGNSRISIIRSLDRKSYALQHMWKTIILPFSSKFKKSAKNCHFISALEPYSNGTFSTHRWTIFFFNLLDLSKRVSTSKIKDIPIVHIL